MRKIQNYNDNNVPTITNLVVAGNPNKKAKTNHSGSSHLDELNQRIDEIENAIGQDNNGPVGRAFAIRAESNKATKIRSKFKTRPEIQKIR